LSTKQKKASTEKSSRKVSKKKTAGKSASVKKSSAKKAVTLAKKATKEKSATPKKSVAPKKSVEKKVTVKKTAAKPSTSEKKHESVISKLANSAAKKAAEKETAAAKETLASQIRVEVSSNKLSPNGNAPTEVVKKLAKFEDFQIGDKVVYPGHGVGEITSFRTKSIGGSEQSIFDITMLESGMKIMVPVIQAQAVGLRKVVDKKAIDEVYTILKMRDCKIDTQTWNRRFREYTQKIKTGSVFEIAEVLRDLTVLSVEKELSFGEKKMLDTAQALLVSEISIAKSRPQERVMGDLQEIFS